MVNRKSQQIDAMRGIAVLLVVLSHADAYEMILLQTQSILFFKGAFGKVGVMLFFVISGYLIWQSATRCFNQYSNAWHRFAILRTARILPLYLVNLLVICLLAGYFQAALQPEITFNNLIRHITFTQDLNPSVSRTLNPVLWSLTHEAIFYCITPLLFILSIRCSGFFKFLIVSLLGLMLLAKFYPNSLFSNFFNYAILFAVGILSAHYQKQPNKLLSAALLMFGLVFTLFSSKQYDFYGYLVIASSLFSLLVSGEFLVKKWMMPLSLLGVISYSVYIWHYLIIELFYPTTLKIELLNELPLRSFLSIVLILAVSTLSYLLIEKPSIKLVRK